MKICEFNTSLSLTRWPTLAVALCAALVSVRPIRAEDPTPAKGAPVNVPAGGAIAPQYWLGVAVENIPPSFAEHLQLPQANQGLMVVGVIPQTPAEKAGLKVNDLLIELNGEGLTSQEQLARGANMPAEAVAEKGKAAVPGVLACDLVYLRKGVRNSVKIVPQLRPVNMLVAGANLKNFTPVANANGGLKVPEMTNYVLPNGQGLQVGPGYRVDLNSEGASISEIKAAVKDGQTLVVSQEADSGGDTFTTITYAGRSYRMPEDFSKLPAAAQPLAQQLMTNSTRAHAVNGNAAVQMAPANGNKAVEPLSLEKRVEEQQQQIQQLMNINRQLQDQMDRLNKRVNSK